MKTTKTWGVVAAAMIASLAVGSELSAQSVSTSAEAAEIDAVRTEAHDLVEKKSGFVRASILFRRASTMGEDRPDAVEDRLMAGRLAYYAGRKGQALDDLEHAGELALSWGDVLTSAQAWLDAAWVANETGNTERAWELATRAERLSHSPLIERQERVALLSRLAEVQEQ